MVLLFLSRQFYFCILTFAAERVEKQSESHVITGFQAVFACPKVVVYYTCQLTIQSFLIASLS